jgi:hypothetical protein
MQVNSDKQDGINADIKAYEFTIYELNKCKQNFNGIELPAPHNKGKNRENAPANTAALSTAPGPAAPAQPAPAIVTKPAKPFAPTTFELPKQQQLPHEPNFCYAAPIEDKAISTSFYDHMLNMEFTVTGREIIATAPEVRRSMKDTTTTHKVPTTANTAKAYVDTNTHSANQVQLCCHEVHHNLLVTKESRSLHSPWCSDRSPIGLLGLLGLSSDYSWLRGLPNIYCESEPVRMESKQSPSDYSESLDSLQTRLRTESDHVRPQSDSTGNLLEFKKYLLP